MKLPGKTAAATKTLPSRDQSRGPHPQKHELLTSEGRLGTPNEMQDPMGVQASYEGRGVGDRAGKSIHSAQVESTASTRICRQVQGSTSEAESSCLTAKGQDDKKTRYSVGTDKRRRKGLPQDRKPLVPRR